MTRKNVVILFCLVAISLWQSSLVTSEEVAEEKDDNKEKRYITTVNGLGVGLGGVNYGVGGVGLGGVAVAGLGALGNIGLGGYTVFDDDYRCGAYNNLGLHYAYRNGYTNGLIRSYVAGGQIGFDIDESLFDTGYLQFSLCPVVNYADPTLQSCFNNHPLYLLDGSDRFFVHRAQTAARVLLRIPQNLNCNSCVLQYHYHCNVINPQNPVTDFYGCSGLRIYPTGYQGAVTGPSAGGIIVNGPANFGNIYGPGSVHNGNSNAFSSQNNAGPTVVGVNGAVGGLVNGLGYNGLGNVGVVNGLGAVGYNGLGSVGVVNGLGAVGYNGLGSVGVVNGLGYNNLGAVGLNGVIGTGCNGGVYVAGCGLGTVVSNPVVRTGVSSSSSVISHKAVNAVSSSSHQVGYGLSGALGLNRVYGVGGLGVVGVGGNGVGGAVGPSASNIAVNGPANFGNIHGAGSVHNGNSNAFSQSTNSAGSPSGVLVPLTLG